ncbi:MAG: nucleotidyl transferase AbiEii/AbiGii toxin family protein [bacterium]
MNEAVAQLLSRYRPETLRDYRQALREILQDVALLGLWRSNFFDKAAFYGGTALRILHGLDRFSEDLDFSLLAPDRSFDLSRYTASLEREVRAFGFDVTCEEKAAKESRAVRSAFLKADTVKELLTIEARPEVIAGIPKGQLIKIKLEVDTDPPPGFETQVRFLLQPVPFSVRTYSLPDLFAGKMHALLYRKWGNRVKGRDWYDLVWFAGNYPELRLSHLEQRMLQSGDWTGPGVLVGDALKQLLDDAIEALDVERARRDVEPFVRDPAALRVWSKKFFRDVADRIVFL